jgi:protein-S-isoprenylcysteine O-methyltransferase Ste14
MWIKPILTVAIASTVGIISAVLQARLEEFDLLRRIPPYRFYVDRVPRFIPRWKKKGPH